MRLSAQTGSQKSEIAEQTTKENKKGTERHTKLQVVYMEAEWSMLQLDR